MSEAATNVTLQPLTLEELAPMPNQYTTTPITERFFANVQFGGPVPEYRPELGPCWLWMGTVNRNGYGMFWDGGRNVRAHRWAYEFCVGPIPDGLTRSPVPQPSVCQSRPLRACH
ncbi:hypothetical protein LCGC14_2989040 [marine sediment metagenome]|uniref:Uncharacterized protein n=1 Tax=marine sediment metagenome TaxID=412755 RepID=A0A0F8XRZ2_9ZZZZ